MSISRSVTELKELAYITLARSGLLFKFSPNSNIALQHQANTTAPIHTFQQELFKSLRRLLQAVIDDQQSKVSNLLEQNPRLLLTKAPRGLKIQSRYTWLTIDAEHEDALSIAVKRKQIKMIELLLSYYEKLPQIDQVITAKQDALSAWKKYVVITSANKNQIVIPKEMDDAANRLITLFKNENFPHGVPGENNIGFDVRLSEITEQALGQLLDRLAPKKAIKLDQHLDAELFLLAAIKAYCKNFESFNYDWTKIETCCIRLIGLIQSTLTPETAKIWCKGLYYAVKPNERNPKRRKYSPLQYQLESGESFYRASRDSRSGNGYDFLCGLFSLSDNGIARAISVELIEKLYLTKMDEFDRQVCAVNASDTPKQTANQLRALKLC
jgi:hypothetical protein